MHLMIFNKGIYSHFKYNSNSDVKQISKLFKVKVAVKDKGSSGRGLGSD